MKGFVAALTLGLALAAPGQAAQYTQIDPDASQIRFTYRQMGVAMEGEFKRFDASLAFDPEDPAAAQVRLDVELASVDTGTADGDAEVASKSWFDTASFPHAQFVSSAVRDLGENRYEVSGTLTIKGTAQPVVVPARVELQGDRALFEGSFTIERGAFSVGEGAWKAFDIVANEVVIRFSLSATAP